MARPTKPDPREVLVCTTTFTTRLDGSPSPVTVHEGERVHAGHPIVNDRTRQYFLPDPGVPPRFSVD